MKIRRLPTDLANQIAAGEVVERPASVVKELVENAIDAGATRVQVEIEQGGTTRVRVSDDGEGMSPDDAALALERHATSKIWDAADLFRLATFGFRGEALPSIASVARLTLVTRTRDADEATQVVVEGGGSATVRPAGAAPGTTITVSDLFFNVPARRKFLKSTGTEGAHVSEVVLLAALARPAIAFTLVRDGRVAKEYLRAADRETRARQVFDGESLARADGARGPMRIEAYLAPPERARAGAGGLHLFVNDRPVKDRTLARAVAQAYGSVLEGGRYPIGAVYIDIPTELVDVNVHPQKAEVRFQDARAIFDVVSRELQPALARAFSLPALGSRPPVPGAFGRGFPSSGYAGSSFTGSGAYVPPARADGEVSTSLGREAPTGIGGDESGALFEPSGFYASLRYLAQARSTFLICEGDDGLYLLDQHAAAERVTFDRLRTAYRARAVAMQRLLVPEVVDLSPEEMAALDGRTEDALGLGLEIRAVGPTAMAIDAIPQVLRRASPARLVRDLASELARDATRPFGAAVDLVLATMACHGSVRAGDRVTDEEARALLRSLDGVDFAGHCPHGRPVVTRLPFSELERRVGR
ncbi:MAG: DNA mismatch repair endonuclease MutL [Polyangiaceae bacterium]